ncbi:hypothetical protein [Agrobacterium tumefaciens]|uniref:hypothetical protein n=1 Tax=Agrobacterium tumefaciens TaxID=358 RepID=UPI001571CEFC|nr:hypothetical protein [Agrobacterium tumefaciens]NTB05870.1 hypothetical protein [Agrobacterium tumefaciens]
MRAPRLSIRALAGGYAYYNAFNHRITLDVTIAEQLDTAHLRTLLAMWSCTKESMIDLDKIKDRRFPAMQ